MNTHVIQKVEFVEGRGGTYVYIKLFHNETRVTTHTSIQVAGADLLKKHFEVLKISELTNKKFENESTDSQTALLDLLDQLQKSNL